MPILPLVLAQAAAPISLAKEEVPGGTLMWAAYLCLWALAFLLLWRLWPAQADLGARVAEAEEKLDAVIAASRSAASKTH